MIQQLVFDLPASHPPTLENFVPGGNAECLDLLRRLAEGPRGPAAAPPIVYLWGDAGSGKSHLLRALHSAAAALGRSARLFGSEGTDPAPDTLFLVDDVQSLDAAGQDRLFALLNQVRASAGQALAATGNAAPADLPLRDDLRSRLAWGLAYRLQPLSDEAKLLALQSIAARRGLGVADEVLNYLLTHGSRDMRALTTLLDELDRYSLARGRAITLPLLRDFARDAGRLE